MEQYREPRPYEQYHCRTRVLTKPCRDVSLITADETLRSPFSVLPKMSVGRFVGGNQSLLHKTFLNLSYSHLSKFHGRSLLNTEMSGTLLWDDIYGTPFSSVDLKGAVGHNLRLERGMPSSHNVQTHGLYELKYFPDASDNSRIMRENGFHTEAYARVWKLNEIQTHEGAMPIDEFKQTLLERAGKKSVLERFLRLGLSDSDVQAYLDETEYTLVERHSQVALCIKDLEYAHSIPDLQNLLFPVFKCMIEAYYKTNKVTFPGSHPIPTFDMYKKDLLHYLAVWLPTQVGGYLRAMHDHELIHGFPHMQNFSAIGTVRDLDSVDGPAVNSSFNDGLVKRKKDDLKMLLGRARELKFSRRLSTELTGGPKLLNAMFLESVHRGYNNYIDTPHYYC